MHLYPWVDLHPSRMLHSIHSGVDLDPEQLIRADAYERHRNAAIEQSQGNRNPLIDHPDWAARIDFAAGFG